ncbi:MAG: hypothetical protein RSG48_01265 [Clostridia bacterium]
MHIQKGSNKMEKYSKKSGITLTALVLTIVVSVILLVATIVGIKNTTNDAALTTFKNEIVQVQDATQSYYVLKNMIPGVDSKGVMNKSSVIALVDEKNKASFELDLNKNLDNDTEEYYQVDLSKIDAGKTKKGKEKRGTDDIYIVAYPSMNVYYLKGLRIKKGSNYEMYYSALDSGATIVSNIEKEIDNSVISLQTVSGISVKKSNAKWTNKMNITITPKIDLGEKISLELSGINTPRNLNIATDTSLFFNDLAQLNQENVLSSNFTAAELSAFDNIAGGKKYIDVVKKNGANEVGRIRIELSNYDSNAPYINSTNVIKYDSINSISCIVSDTSGSVQSGVKEIRYDYLTKYGKDSRDVGYYDNISTFDDTYMRTKAKKAVVSGNLQVDLKIPKDVKKMKLSVIDNAGNISSTDINVVSGIYISQQLTGYLENYTSFNLYINSINGVSNIDTYLSTDGINYINKKSQTFRTGAGVTTAKFEYTDSPKDADNLFVKVVATDNNSVVGNRQSETTIFLLTRKSKTVNDYIQDGLLLNYDAIQNTKNAHSSTSSVWEDLTANGHNGTFVGFDAADQNSGFKDNYVKFDGVNDWIDTGLPGDTTFTANSEFTLSIMMDFNQITAVGPTPPIASEGDTGVLIGCADYNGYGISWRTSTANPNEAIIAAYMRSPNNEIESIYAGSKIKTSDKKNIFTQVYSKKGDFMKFYYNGNLMGTTGTTKGPFDHPQYLGNIGINKAQIWVSNYRVTNADINVYSARIYNRALSEDEVKINSNVDRIRYGI